MPILTHLELDSLRTGDKAYAVIVSRDDDDGSRELFFAGQTSFTISDHPSGRREFSPEARPELVFDDSSLHRGRFVSDNLICVLCTDANSARAELDAAKPQLVDAGNGQIKGLELID